MSVLSLRELWTVVVEKVQVLAEGVGSLLRSPWVEVMGIDRGHLYIITYGSFFFMCYYCNRFVPQNQRQLQETASPQSNVEQELRDKERVFQEVQERNAARAVMEQYLENAPNFQHCADMGCRLQKYWTKFSLFEDQMQMIMTIAPVPKNCPLTPEDVDTMKTILRTLKHPNLAPSLVVSYQPRGTSAVGTSDYVIVKQDLYQGSLRDLIHRQLSDFTSDWSVKYMNHSTQEPILSAKVIASCGRQILEAVTYLHSQNFPPLGHIHVGNIFITLPPQSLPLPQEGKLDMPPTCFFGGHVNTLLGYRPRLYRVIADAGLLDRIDVVMFGHVIYEMACGRELAGATPTEQEYQAVMNSKVKNLVRKIFELKSESKTGMSEILSWKFFKVDLPAQCHTLPEDLRRFLTDKYGPSAHPKAKTDPAPVSSSVEKQSSHPDTEDPRTL